ncbi:tripartite tricarboxylate transporter substrate binding protein [Salinarimonas ramus]|uniref:C4-dicarboxylate ABC transporter substrate-binding protein n=1 Tax=Salinarimonas ramus TaxID=690164 RepID=A0A917Q9V5_9HYPH|nr:tripartite tricarboxylate transporter substrate binding protein [Salinarimonas ramus]GGK37966.1 C4-dicarboxylate ABC transporter substrate-binding protein [Salinarimonas ramus]
MIRKTPFLAAPLVAATLGAAIAATPALAFPDKDVDYIIPFSPGGESDIAARLQQPVFADEYDHQLIVKYQAGAGGAQAWSQLNSMPADGHTIMGINLPHVILQPMMSSPGYETADLTPVYWFHYTPDAIIVKADSQFQTLEDLVTFAEANPGLVTFSGSGSNSANSLAKSRFDALAGVTTTYVPFSGTGPSVTALLGDQVTASWGYSTVAAAQGDQVRMLAVASEERLPLFPDVPTFQELGYDMTGGAYRGVAVPKDTPEETRQAVSDAFQAMNNQPAMRKAMDDGAFVVIDVPYSDMESFMSERRAEIEEAAKASN